MPDYKRQLDNIVRALKSCDRCDDNEPAQYCAECLRTAIEAAVGEERERIKDGACDLCGGTDHEDFVCDKCLKRSFATQAAQCRAVVEAAKKLLSASWMRDGTDTTVGALHSALAALAEDGEG